MRGICTMYGLPCTKYKARESRDMVAEHVDIPRDSSHGNTMCWPDISWDEGCHRFVFDVDCQPLQRISCGRTPLLNDSYFPLFRRILDNLKDIFKEGFVPPRLVDDPVLWVRREKNKLADYLCNVTMDRKRSWSRTRSIDMPSKYHWFAVSDGGARPQCSACGWSVGICFMVDGAYKFEPLVVAGQYLEPRVNSFLAETLALEQATLEMKKLTMHFKQ